MIQRLSLATVLAAALAAPFAVQAADAPRPGATAPTLAAPDRLPAQVVGVIGSGDQLSLRIRQGETVRTLKPGDLYEDGWTLTALTADNATLGKDGQVRRVGLNPDGAFAQGEARGAPSQVTTVGGRGLDAARINDLLEQMRSAGAPAIPGMSAEESQAMIARAQALIDTPEGRAAIQATAARVQELANSPEGRATLQAGMQNAVTRLGQGNPQQQPGAAGGRSAPMIAP